MCSQLVIPLAACGAVPDGSIRLAAVLHSLVLWHSRLHRSSETDSTNRGDEAPVFGPGNPLFFDPSYPKRQASESAFDLQISIWVGDQRIPGVVCSFLETKSLIPTFWRSACLAGLSGACSGPAAQESHSVFFLRFCACRSSLGWMAVHVTTRPWQAGLLGCRVQLPLSTALPLVTIGKLRITPNRDNCDNFQGRPHGCNRANQFRPLGGLCPDPHLSR